MAGNCVRCPVAVVFPKPGTDDFCSDKCTYAANHVNGRGTGKIVKAYLGQPSAAPDPMAGHRIDEDTDRCRIDEVGREFRPFRHGAGDDGRGSGTEHRMENHEYADGESVDHPVCIRQGIGI